MDRLTKTFQVFKQDNYTPKKNFVKRESQIKVVAKNSFIQNIEKNESRRELNRPKSAATIQQSQIVRANNFNNYNNLNSFNSLNKNKGSFQ